MTPEQQAEELWRAYQLTFNSPAGQRVLQDLMAFGCFRVPITNDVDEGKRQVVLRIMDYSQWSFEELKTVYAGRMAVKDPNRPAKGEISHDDRYQDNPPA